MFLSRLLLPFANSCYCRCFLRGNKALSICTSHTASSKNPSRNQKRKYPEQVNRAAWRWRAVWVLPLPLARAHPATDLFHLLFVSCDNSFCRGILWWCTVKTWLWSQSKGPGDLTPGVQKKYCGVRVIQVRTFLCTVRRRHKEQKQQEPARPCKPPARPQEQERRAHNG